ncbi:MAG: M50 family metallopeptidase [Clostridia bacterium]|nr:M50 family metallopeptidase [Clostridia bacterium]
MKQIGRYLLILIAVMALWNSIVIKPLKIFTVFLHELGHALMAFIFGYGIQAFKVNFNESGYTMVQPKGWFSTFMIANGGYLGSILFALLILHLKRTSYKKYILGTLAIVFLTISIKFSGFSFTLLYSILFAVAVLMLYMVQSEKLNDWIIDIIGIASVAYAVYDTFVDTILLQLNLQFHLIEGWGGKQPMTDAVQLQQLTHIPAIVWGVLWMAIALFAVYTTLLKSAGKARR